MLLYHNSAACCNTGKKLPSKSKSKSSGKRKNSVKKKKEYKCATKSKRNVICSKEPKPPGLKKTRTSNKKISKKNSQFLKGLGLKLNRVEN